LSLRRVWAEVELTNVRSLAIVRALGMAEVGRRTPDSLVFSVGRPAPMS
jgi:RimJ/RimL family protein N-acetyltransferase